MEAAAEQPAPEQAPAQEQHVLSDELVKARLQELLKTADLTTTTEKQLRKKLEEELKCDLTDRKLLIRQEVELFLAQQVPDTEASAQLGEEIEEDEGAEEEAEEEKPKKPARKRSAGSALGSVLSPAMQAFVGAETMPRPHVVRAIWDYIKANNLQNPKDKRKIIVDEKLATILKPPVTMFSMNKQISKHCRTKASVAGVDDEEENGEGADEDDADDADKEEDKPKKKPAKRAKKEGGGGGGGGFQTPVQISDELAEFLGSSEPISRPALTKKFWEYFKENNLQDPSNKRNIKCDERLEQLLGVKSFPGFGLMKHLGKHIVKQK